LIGQPFEYGQMDCWILARKTFEKFGVIIPEHNVAYSAIEKACFDSKVAAKEIWKRRTDWERIDEPEAPCIVALSFETPDYFDHIGVYIGGDKFIHATRRIGAVVIETLSHPLYVNRQKRFYRYVSDADRNKRPV